LTIATNTPKEACPPIAQLERIDIYDERRRMPTMSSDLPGGELEYAVLVALWDLGAATTREIHERVGEPDGLVYTTTAKVLDRLHAKQLVTRERTGKSFVYRAKVKRESIERARARLALNNLLGSEPRPAIAALIDAVSSLDADLLDELARAINAKRRSRPGT
jgi:predicted transcriptional regulator